ncbi:MAG: amino acid racemase [Ruminococcaceae bacterium]|nr:amino acid racemase [Oscillospiraceae bacterium]
MKRARTLGVLGGLGPMATAYFYEMITDHTKAERDQDHIDMVISSRVTTPDRTAYIVGESKEDPLEYMTDDAKRLERYGADVLVIPCNTAHYFYDELQNAVGIPIINIVDETVRHCIAIGSKKVGILATSGTLGSGTYQMVCNALGLDFEIPDEADQQKIMSLIYNDIKKGKRADMKSFDSVADHLKEKGCDRIILGCTELSLIKKNEGLDGGVFVDSLEALAYRTIVEYGKEPIGFHSSYGEK